jgi:hypothetical protein
VLACALVVMVGAEALSSLSRRSGRRHHTLSLLGAARCSLGDRTGLALCSGACVLCNATSFSLYLCRLRFLEKRVNRPLWASRHALCLCVMSDSMLLGDETQLFCSKAVDADTSPRSATTHSLARTFCCACAQGPRTVVV